MYIKDIESIGFKSVGKNVLISDKSTIYNAKNIEIGDNVRIDDFCVISAGEGGIKIGNNVHIAVFCSLIGNGLITDTASAFVYKQNPEPVDEEKRPLFIRSGQLMDLYISSVKTFSKDTVQTINK